MSALRNKTREDFNAHHGINRPKSPKRSRSRKSTSRSRKSTSRSRKSSFRKVKQNESDELPMLNELRVLFLNYRDTSVEDKISDQGGKIVSKLSKNTNLVVYRKRGDDQADIAKNADKMGIDVLTVNEFLKVYNL